MPIGITRAADRNAIWLEAADDDGINSDDYLQQKYVTKPDGLTGEDYLNADYTPIQPEDVAVTPDGGMVPDGAGTITGPPPVPAAPVAPAVVIPNTNKFKPVNGLKKLLDSIPDDAEPGIGPHGMNLTNWLAGHQPFVHTYLKPNYADAVKASVGGDKAYAKLLKHAPTQVSTALTTHTQHPAPNSNKFKTPANGLKKLLDNPNTTPEHVQAWIDKHPAFAKGYLHNPSYQDAVKGWIGEDNYHGWQEHLQVPAAPKPDKAKAIADQAAEAFAPAGFVPKTQEQFFHDHVPEGSGPQAPLPPTPGAASPGEIAPEDQPDIDAIKSQMQPADQFQMPPDDQFTDAGPLLDDALGPKPSVGAQIKALIPDKTNVTAETLDAKIKGKTPEQIKTLFDKTITQNPSLGPKLQKIYDDNFGQPSQPLAPEDQTEAEAIKSQMAPTGLQPGELSVVPPSVPPEDQAEVDGIKQQALAEGIKAIFPSVDPSVATMPVEKQKQLLESWKTHLVHTPDHNDNLTKITKLYDQYFGQQPAAGAGGYDGLSGEMKPVSVQDASDAIGGNPWGEEEEGPPPGFQQWYTEQIDNTPGAWENEPPEMKTNLVKQYQGDLDYANPPLAPEDQAEAEAIKAQMSIDYAEPVNVDNPAEAAAGPDKYTKSFDKWLQNKGYPPASQLFEEVESLDDFYDLKAQYKDEYEAGQATTGKPAQPFNSAKLTDAVYKAIGPPAESFLSLNAQQAQDALTKKITFYKSQGYDKQVQSLQDVYDHFFGGAPSGGTAQPEWAALTNTSDPAKAKQTLEKWLQSPSPDPSWKAIYDKYFGGGAPAPAALTPGQKKKQLLKDLMVEMPTPPGQPGGKWTYAIIGTDPLAVQTQMKALIDYGADPDGKIKAVYRKHFGDTPLPPTGPPPGKLTSAIFKKYFPDGGYLDWAKGGNVEAQKAAIKDHIDGLKKEKASLWGAAKWQAIYDEAFGPDLTGFNQDFKTIMPGLDMGALSPAAQQQQLQKLIDSNAGSPTGKALKALQDKYFSGQSAAPGGGPVFNADQYIADLSTASGFTPEEYASSWKDPKTAPHELADYLDYLKKFDSNSALLPQYQAIYDKWFAAQPPMPTSKPGWWVGDWSPSLQHSIEFSDFSEFVNAKGYDAAPTDLDDDVWAVLAQEYNHLLGIAPGGDYYVEPSTTSDPNKPSLAWVQEHWGPGYFKDQAELDQWYSNWAKNPAANDAPGVLKKWLNDDYGDKDQYQQGAPSDSPFNADSMPGPLDNPFGTGSMGVAYDHDPKFQQWWQSQSPDFQTEYIAKPLSAYQQYSKDMETAGTPIPQIDNWSQNPWAQGSEEEEETPAPLDPYAYVVSEDPKENDDFISKENDEYGFSIKMYNLLHTQPGLLQSWIKLTDGEKNALALDTAEQNQWANDHKNDPYVPAGQTPTFDSTALTSEVGNALGLKMPPGIDAWAEQWKSPETAGPILQKVIQDSKSDPTQQAALQAIYNKYFGGAAGFAETEPELNLPPQAESAPKTFPPFSHLDPWNNTLSTMFKQWFAADNSAFDLDDPGSADQVKMLKDTTNNWTKQKLQGFKKFTDWLQSQPMVNTALGVKIGEWDTMSPQAQAAWIKKYYEDTNQHYDPEALPSDEPKPLPDWLNANESGYPDWVDEDDSHAQDEYYHWLTDQQPDDLQYWAQHPDHAQKSFQYFLDPDTKGVLLHPSEFEKVEEGGPPVDVNAAIQNGTLYAEMQDAAGSEHILLKDFWTGKYPPEKLQSTVLTWLNGAKAGDKEYGGLTAAPKLQALYDKYFGNAGLAYNPDLFAEDVAGILEDNKSLWDYISPEKAKEALKNHLDKPETWNHSPEDLAQLQQVYNKWFGGGSSAPAGGTVPFKGGLDFVHEYLDAANWKGATPELANVGGVKFMDMTAEQAKKKLEHNIQVNYGDPVKMKALYNKYFGSGVAAPTGGTPKWKPTNPSLSLPSNMLKPDGSLKPELLAFAWGEYTNASDFKKDPAGYVQDWLSKINGTHKEGDYSWGSGDWQVVGEEWEKLSQEQKQKFIDQGIPDELKAALQPAATSRPSKQPISNWAQEKWGDNADIEQPAFNAWFKQKYPDSTKGPDENGVQVMYDVEALAQEWDALSSAEKAPFYDGGGSGAAGPAPFDAEAIIQGLIKADPDFWGDEHDDLAEHGPDWHKHNLEALIKQGEDGDFPPEEWAQYKALYEKYFGEGGTEEEEVAAPSIGKQLQKLINDYTGTDTVSDEVAEAYDNKSPADLQNVIVNIKDGYPSDLGEKVQQLFEQHLKGGTPAPLVHVDDLGEQMHAIDDTFNATSINAKTAEDQKKLLEYWLKDEGQKGKPKIKALLDKYFGSGAQPAQVSPMDYDKDQALAEWKAIFPGFNPALAPKFWTADEAEKYAHQWLQSAGEPSSIPEKKAQAQAFYDKWFGKGVFIPDPSAASGLSNAQITDLLHQADEGYWNYGTLEDFLAMTPEDKKAKMQYWIDQGVQGSEAKIYKQIIDGLSGQAAPAGGTPAYDKDQVWAEYTKIYPNSKLQNNFATADSAQAWLMKQKSKTGISALNKKNLDALYEKYFGAGAPAAGSTSPAASPLSSSVYFKPTAEEIQGLGIAPDLAKDLANFADGDFKTSYDWVKGQMAAGNPNWKDPNNNWVKIVNYIDSKAPSTEPAFAPPPPPLPPFEPGPFAAAFKTIWPGSGWATDPHPAEESKIKLQDQLDKAVKQYPGTDKTNQGIALYEKYFGPFKPSTGTVPSSGPPPPPPLAPMTPDEAYAKLVSQADTGNFKTFQTPGFKTWFMNQPAKQINWAKNPDVAAIAYEEAMLPPPEPPQPFKSQPFDPDALTHWAANKPISEAGWKNFSTWWANTQIPPEGEQSLYKTWFGKDASPEQAGAWFQAMFEHHAEPSEGDLGLQAGVLPNWAESTWAFGKNAAQEWPVFQQWATKDPGLPSGTKIKQKLMVWNSLSPEEKAAIADNYLPAQPVDNKAILADLAKAYPDSNWKPWLNLGQGTLKANLLSLAETGAYPGVIAAYNKYFGGNIPMPEPLKPGQKPKKLKEPPALPIKMLPQWMKDYSIRDFLPNKAGAKNFTQFLRWAESIGRGPEAKGEVADPNGYHGRPQTLIQTWNKLAPHLKAQIGTMAQLPWKDEAGYNAWSAAQPTMKQEVEAIKGDLPGGGWYSDPNNNKLKMDQLLQEESDPHKKQALLDLYQKYYGADKPTLAEALKAADPSTDWDKYLKTTAPDVVAKLLKKKIKDETDPDKFVRYCDMWSKFFTGPPGNKALSSMLGKGHSGGTPLSLNALKKLWQWKAGGDPTANVNNWGWQDAKSPYIDQQQEAWQSQSNYPLYYGWTPKWEPGGSDYVPDPAMLGTSGAPTAYDIPQLHKGQEYQDVLDSVGNFTSGFLSQHDMNVLKSDGFQNWFERSTPDYKATWKDHPATLLDDYSEFINHGGTTYGPTFGPSNPDGSKVYDLSPFNLIPKPGDKDIKNKNFADEFTHNPPRSQNVKFPRNQDAQETLPLAPGDRWAPNYAAMPIYRLIPNDVLDLDATPSLSSRFNKLPERQREHLLELQRYRLRKIDQIINGPEAKRDYASDRAYFNKWCNSHSISEKDKADIENQIFAVQPILSDDEKWKYFEDWASKNNVEPAAMYELASKVGVGNPGEGVPNTKGSYDHPELAQLILDYLENGRGGSTIGNGLGGLGVHWTRAKDILYAPKDSGVGGAQAMKPGGVGTNVGGRKIPLFLWGLWGGQGEESHGSGGAYSADTDSELEHNLSTGAPVFLRRLQIRDQSGDFHDLIDPGPISTWAAGRDESSSGRKSKDKESLATRLDYDFPNIKHDPEEWDRLVPGPEADAKFAKLLDENGLLIPGVGIKDDKSISPAQKAIKDKLLKAYRHFFVGRPDLPPPHHRFASVPTQRVAAAEQLFDMATAWGVTNPERYGLPRHYAAAAPPRPRPRAVAYAPERGTEVRRPHGITTVHERYL